MTQLYQIKQTTDGKETYLGDKKSQAETQSDLADLSGYMKRQGAQIVVQTTNSFAMSRAKIITKYDVVAVE